MKHVAFYGCPRPPAEPRAPYPYERRLMLVMQRRAAAGERLAEDPRPLNQIECSRVSFGKPGDATDELILSKWRVLWARAAANRTPEKEPDPCPDNPPSTPQHRRRSKPHPAR